MQTPSRSTPSVSKPKRRRFPWVISMLVSSVLIAILAFVAVTLLILNRQGVTQGVNTLTILSIVVGFAVSALSLLVSFLQWHHPKALSALEEVSGDSGTHSSVLSASKLHPVDEFLPDPGMKDLEEKAVLAAAGQKSRHIDWGEAPHLEQFYGREQELATLSQWMTKDSCRVVTILGMGGIGKTSLAATLVEQVHEQYDYILWRSLHNAPPFKQVIEECLRFFSQQQHTVFPEERESQISLFIESLRASRCLFVLDNVEAIFQERRQAGQYREGYEGYGRLFQRVGASKHQSCLLLTSREKPPEVALLEGDVVTTVRSLHVKGLQPGSGREILSEKGLQGTERDWEELISHYGGNPLALKLVAQVIREVFGGSIAAFLTHGEWFFQDVNDVLEQQMKRLPPLEEEILYWLAIEREALTLSALQADMVSSVSKGGLQEALQSLRRRQLIEASEAGFTLHPVIMDYQISRLVNGICEEITTGTLALFERHALLLAQTKEYIRESQLRFILLPLLHQLLTIFGREALEQQFQKLLAILHAKHDHYPGYATGNVLNLLIQMGYELRGYDFSHLVVRQAYLQRANLSDVNFAQADLANAVFTDMLGSILCMAFRPQGGILVAGTTTGEIRGWRVGSGLSIPTIRGHNHCVRSVAFSPDGKILASGSEDRTVRLWEVSSGRCLATLQGYTSAVWSVAFSPDGKCLASGSEDRAVRLWEVSSGQRLASLQGYTSVVRSVAFSPDGKALAIGGEDRTVRLWEVRSGECLATLQGYTSAVWSVAFSPDGKTLATGSDDQMVRLWETSSGQILTTLQGHTAWVRSVAFSPDGKTLASGSADRTVRLWEVHSGECLATLQGYTSAVWSVAFSPDGKMLATGGNDQMVRLWEISSGQILTTLQGYATAVRSVAFSPDGKLLVSGGEDRVVRLWEVSSGQILTTLQGHTDWVRSVAFSPDGRTLASGGDDQTVRLWNMSNDQCLTILQGYTAWVRSVVFSPDGKTLATGGNDQAVCLWETSSGQILNTLQGHTDWVRSVAFSPDGQMLASGSADRTIRLWEIGSGRCLTLLQGHTDWVRSVAFSPDGKTLVSGSDDWTVRLWEVKSGHALITLQGHTSVIRSVAFSPDGKTLASGGYDGSVHVWEASSGTCLTSLQGHTDWVRSVAFSPDGQMLASGGSDGTIRVWDTQTGACLHTLRSDRPYERMNITQVKGLTEVQKATLRLLGAIENE
jgi:WD40 repeat protein